MAKRTIDMLHIVFDGPEPKKQRADWVQPLLEKLKHAIQIKPSMRKNEIISLTSKSLEDIESLICYGELTQALTKPEWQLILSAIERVKILGNILTNHTNEVALPEKDIMIVNERISGNYHRATFNYNIIHLAIERPTILTTKHHDYRRIILNAGQIEILKDVGGNKLIGEIRWNYATLYNHGIRRSDDIVELSRHRGGIESIRSFICFNKELERCGYRFSQQMIITLCKCQNSRDNITTILTYSNQFLEYGFSSDQLVHIGGKSGNHRVLKMLANPVYFKKLIEFGFTLKMLTSTLLYQGSTNVLQCILMNIYDGTFNRLKIDANQITTLFSTDHARFDGLLKITGKTADVVVDWFSKMDTQGNSTTKNNDEDQPDETLSDLFKFSDSPLFYSYKIPNLAHVIAIDDNDSDYDNKGDDTWDFLKKYK
jgi:hypothetical protein